MFCALGRYRAERSFCPISVSTCSVARPTRIRHLGASALSRASRSSCARRLASLSARRLSAAARRLAAAASWACCFRSSPSCRRRWRMESWRSLCSWLVSQDRHGYLRCNCHVFVWLVGGSRRVSVSTCSTEAQLLWQQLPVPKLEEAWVAGLRSSGRYFTSSFALLRGWLRPSLFLFRATSSLCYACACCWKLPASSCSNMTLSHASSPRSASGFRSRKYATSASLFSQLVAAYVQTVCAIPLCVSLGFRFFGLSLRSFSSCACQRSWRCSCAATVSTVSREGVSDCAQVSQRHPTTVWHTSATQGFDFMSRCCSLSGDRAWLLRGPLGAPRRAAPRPYRPRSSGPYRLAGGYGVGSCDVTCASLFSLCLLAVLLGRHGLCDAWRAKFRRFGDSSYGHGRVRASSVAAVGAGWLFAAKCLSWFLFSSLLSFLCVSSWACLQRLRSTVSYGFCASVVGGVVLCHMLRFCFA